MKHLPSRLSVLVLMSPLWAQSFDDLVTFRNPVLPYAQVLQVRAGVLSSVATEQDATAGLDDEVAWDANVWYHSETAGSAFDAYAGRDGFVGSLRDGSVVGSETATRLQLSTRLWPFYREGFYRGDSYVPTGRYEGRDWEAYLGFGRTAAEDLFVEFGPFYRQNDFSRSADTAPTYIEPDDHTAYGGRLHIEQNTVQLDRRTGLPRQGFLVGVIAEREWNDSDDTFGVLSGFTSQLPSSVWRARGRLEWYLPQSSDSAWEVFASAALTDEGDRVVAYDAQHPQGNLWVDAQLRWRLPVGDAISVAPFVHAQFLRILEEDGGSADKKLFFGGGVDGWVHFSEAVSMNVWYSFLDNESRPSVSITEDLHGQHMFFAGFVLRFGATRR